MAQLPLTPDRKPTSSQLVALIGIEDPLLLAIRGHQAIDALLTTAITSALPDPHQVEVERLSFTLKVDLAVALKRIPQDCRGMFTALNRVRNRLTHDAAAALDEQTAAEIRSAYAAPQRESFSHLIDRPGAPVYTLQLLVGILFQQLRVLLQQTLDHAIEEQVTSEILREALEDYEKRNPNQNLDPISKEFSEKIAQRKSEIYKT